MLIGSYFVARAGIATGAIFLAIASGILATSGRHGALEFARDTASAGYLVSAISLIFYVGVLHA